VSAAVSLTALAATKEAAVMRGYQDKNSNLEAEYAPMRIG
jgi:hypothetical protein